MSGVGAEAVFEPRARPATSARGNVDGPLVTVAIPVYQNLRYLARAVRAVAAQDYPNLELLVSDNGHNGSTVPGIVAASYPGAWRLRQNPRTVPLVSHFNQLIEAAGGEYVVLLGDDDELTPNYVSTLLGLLEKHPRASVAIGQLRVVDEAGRVLSRSRADLPELLRGDEFLIQRCRHARSGFKNTATHLARRCDLLASGGYPQLHRGLYSDDGLILRLALFGHVTYSARCAFLFRANARSYGRTGSNRDMARGSREYLRFFDAFCRDHGYAEQHPARYRRLRREVRTMVRSYCYRSWRRSRRDLGWWSWASDGVTMPLSASLYARGAARILREAAATPVRTYRRRNGLTSPGEGA